jgi:predicted nucleic acid-binding protein
MSVVIITDMAQLCQYACRDVIFLLILHLSHIVIMFIFDASTLILIAKTEILDPFLRDVGLDVAIPLEVEKECCSVKKSLDALMIRKALDESRIRVIAVKNRKLVTKIQEDFGLGRGEAEAIVLALAEKARILGIDDKNGINACKLLGVAFTTAIGILVRMCEKRLLTTSEALAKLEGLAKYGRYKKSILEDATRQLEAAT